jgi:omega-amidase
VTTSPERDADFVAACVQFDVRRGDVSANLAAARSGLTAAAEQGATLAVLPELWSTSFVAQFEAATVAAAAQAEEEIRQLSSSLSMVVVGSSLEADQGRIHNSARVYDRGAHLGTYRKIHLFSPNAEDRHHASGDQPLLADTSVGRLGVLICYDLRFPDLARFYFHRGAQMLVVPGQWPEARTVHWRTLLRARAIENELFVIGCNRTGQEGSLKNNDTLQFPGDSRIVDPMGEILASGNGEDGPLVATIEPRKVRTMRRILPVARDQRPDVYRRLWDSAWPDMVKATRQPRRRAERPAGPDHG